MWESSCDLEIAIFLRVGTLKNSEVIGVCWSFKREDYRENLVLEAIGRFLTQTLYQKCTSHKKQNDTCCTVVITTLLVPVSFCQKPN